MAHQDTELLTAALAGYQQRLSEIDEKLAELRTRLSTGRDGYRSTGTGTPDSGAQRKRRRMSAAARKRIGDAQRKRWAAARGGAEAESTARKAPPKKRRMSAAGRARIVAALKKRWAAVKKAKTAGATKRSAPKHVTKKGRGSEASTAAAE